MSKQFTHTQKDIQLALKHMKKCWNSLIIREMQIKTTLKLHFSSTTLAKSEAGKHTLVVRLWANRHYSQASLGGNANW